MAAEKMHAQMGGKASSEEFIPAGAVTFGLEYRSEVGGGMGDGDQGVCIHVYGNDLPGTDRELLRFDCFDKAPHYHYRNAAANKNERIMLDYTAEGDPIPWTLDKIKNRLPIMLVRCGVEDIARKLDQREIDAALPKVAARAETLSHQK